MKRQTVLATEDQTFTVSKIDPTSETESRVYFTDKPAQYNKPEGWEEDFLLSVSRLGIFSQVGAQG